MMGIGEGGGLDVLYYTQKGAPHFYSPGFPPLAQC